jgi:hypothetical protein
MLCPNAGLFCNATAHAAAALKQTRNRDNLTMTIALS